nr:unnamed protein product [Digitaria exilis]
MATASFVAYLQRPRELPVPEFRAPPPSPVTGVLTGSSSGSSGYGEGQDDDDIGRFLRCSARVPVLRLPERPGPRRNNKKKPASWAPPVIDMRVLCSPSTGAGPGPAVEALTSAAVAFGCFQVVGHEVDEGLVLAALRAATARERSSASAEDAGGGDEDSEELWWPPGGEGDREMAGNRPLRNGIKQIRNAADDLFAQLEQASAKLLDALRQGNEADDTAEPLAKAAANGSLLCIRKNHASSASGPVSQDDVLRMLVRSSRCSRTLALHLCPGASAFHVFSRRGWSRFRPLDGAIVVTVGDQLQSVSGKPAYSSDDHQGNGGDSAISAEFFLSCSSAGAANDTLNLDAGKVFPLNLQILVAICLVLIYHFFLSCLYVR